MCDIGSNQSATYLSQDHSESSPSYSFLESHVVDVAYDEPDSIVVDSICWPRRLSEVECNELKRLTLFFE